MNYYVSNSIQFIYSKLMSFEFSLVNENKYKGLRGAGAAVNNL